MPIDPTLWQGANFLSSPKRIAKYLDAVFEDGDPALIAAALGDLARARGMTSVARDIGIRRETLYRGLFERGNPKLATVLDLLKTFGLKLTVVAD